MIKTKVRLYTDGYKDVPVKVWKIGKIVIWRKKLVDKPAKPA